MQDLTIVFLTVNELPQRWVEFHRKHLVISAAGRPIITISRKPVDLGKNVIDTDEKGYWNIYRQMLRGARLAETEFVANVEDDTLYSPEHFSEFRPKADEVSYNRSRWSLFEWDPIFCLRQRISNCTCIAPRKLLIEALEERFAKYPNNSDPPADFIGEVGRKNIEEGLKVTRRKLVEFYSTVPVIQLNHMSATEGRQVRKWKKHGQIKAYDIPYWGKATDIVKEYHDA